jgi:hypothetical protein
VGACLYLAGGARPGQTIRRPRLSGWKQSREWTSLGSPTDGLRNLTGVVNGDDTATIYAVTSTVSGNGDQGADPNKLVTITDSLGAGGPNAPNGETFTTLRSAGNLEVLRGVSFGPGTGN